MRFIVPLLLAANLHAAETLTLGLASDHYNSDESYNEDNRIVQYSRTYGGNHVATVATFVNSYYERAYLVGYGLESRYGSGVLAAAVYGYEGHIDTVEGLLFVPVLYQKLGPLRFTAAGNALSLGLELEL